MASKGGIIEGPEWARIERHYKKAPHLLAKRLKIALGRVGLRAEREIRDWIRQGKWPRNAALTLAVKGKKARFLDQPQGMIHAITHKVEKDHVNVGILRNAPKGNSTMFNVAAALIAGARIRVTPKMRAMFRALANASKGGGGNNLRGRAAELFKRNKDWKPLRASTQYIVIPGYDFIAEPLEHAEFANAATKILEKAFAGALGKS
jgi:hypothetical protein